MIKYIILAIVGLIEAFGSTLNSKFRQKTKKLFSFITAFINILVWYFIISMVIENISNAKLAVVYALFYSIGDVLGLTFDSYIDRLAKIRGFRFFKKKKKHHKRKR